MDATLHEDTAFVAALQSHDNTAYEELVRQHGPAMLSVARRMMRHERDAEDAVQDALLSAVRALPGFRGECRLSTWLHRIVINAALMQIRRRQRHPEEPIEPFLPTFTADGRHTAGVCAWHSSEAALATRETQVAVRAAITRLPSPYRTVLVLRDIEECPTQDVATLLGVTPNAVKVRLHRARQALVTQLQPVFGSSFYRRPRTATPPADHRDRDRSQEPPVSRHTSNTTDRETP